MMLNTFLKLVNHNNRRSSAAFKNQSFLPLLSAIVVFNRIRASTNYYYVLQNIFTIIIGAIFCVREKIWFQ